MHSIRLDERDAGGRTGVGADDIVEILLPETPTTGYRWRFDVPDGATVLQNEFLPEPPDRPGQGGVRRVLITTAAPGSHRVHAELARPWEGVANRSLDFELDVR